MSTHAGWVQKRVCPSAAYTTGGNNMKLVTTEDIQLPHPTTVDCLLKQ